MFCPFCGGETTSEDYCSQCGTRFTKQIRDMALKEDTRDDRVGPFSTKTAKRLLYVLMILLLIAFFAFTEMAGNGVLSLS